MHRNANTNIGNPILCPVPKMLYPPEESEEVCNCPRNIISGMFVLERRQNIRTT